MDLQVRVQFPDGDGDGLPDDWEIQHFGNNYAKPNDDPDGDGMSNLQEYLAGTDPNDPRSVAKIAVEKNPNGIVVQWQSESGRYYRIMKSRTCCRGSSRWLRGYRRSLRGIAIRIPMLLVLVHTFIAFALNDRM